MTRLTWVDEVKRQREEIKERKDEDAEMSVGRRYCLRGIARKVEKKREKGMIRIGLTRMDGTGSETKGRR